MKTTHLFLCQLKPHRAAGADLWFTVRGVFWQRYGDAYHINDTCQNLRNLPRNWISELLTGIVTSALIIYGPI